MTKQKMIYIIVQDVDQGAVDALGFTEWLKAKREELAKTFATNKVFIVAV